MDENRSCSRSVASSPIYTQLPADTSTFQRAKWPATNLVPQELLFSSQDLCQKENQKYCSSFFSSKAGRVPLLSPCVCGWRGQAAAHRGTPRSQLSAPGQRSPLGFAGLMGSCPRQDSQHQVVTLKCIAWALLSTRKAQIPVHPPAAHPVQQKGRFWCEKPQTSKMHLAKILSSHQKKIIQIPNGPYV